MADWADEKARCLMSGLDMKHLERSLDPTAAALRETAAEWYQRGAGDVGAILGPGDPVVLVGNLVIERDRLAHLLEESEKREQTAYQRGVEEMRERAAHLCGDMAAQPAYRRVRHALSFAKKAIRALPLVADETSEEP